MVNKVSWKARESVKCRYCRRCHYFMSVHLLQCFANSSFSLNIFNLQLVQFIDMETMQMERRFCSAQQIHMHDLQSSPPSYTFPQKKGIYLNIKRRAQEYSKQHYFKVPSTICLHIWNVIHPYLLCVLWALSMPCVWARLISSDLWCSCFFCLPSARLQAWATMPSSYYDLQMPYTDKLYFTNHFQIKTLQNGFNLPLFCFCF